MAKQRSMYGKDDLYVTDRSNPNATRVTDVQKWRTNQDDIRHLPGALPIQRLAIQDGSIGPSAAFIVVDTEGGAPADDLTAINPGDLHDGMEIELSSADSSRIVTIKNSTTFSGIRTIRGEDLVLGMSCSIRLKLISTESITYWQELPTAVKISDSVALEDSDIAASSLAAKTAYDRGSAGIAAAETAQASVVTLRSDVPAIAAKAAAPSPKYIDYAAPGNGVSFLAPENGYMNIRMENAPCSIYAGAIGIAISPPYDGANAEGFIPVEKGENVVCYYSGSMTLFRFVYANGNAPA